ncbi:hypothetical protein MUP01_05715 [Candidatus Bathyarchaeota archaeon]|nr:hypothetical protein [Candidatus Bathyarchaeota archaeon]
MTKRVMVLIVASIAVVATLALVSVGLSHGQAMMENVGFMWSTGGHMSQDNHGNCEENMSTHMNTKQHMSENMFDECEDVQGSMNMTGHIMGMH